MSTAPTKLVAALDLGSTKVTAVVAEAGGDARRPTARVLGVGIERSNGIRRGVVRDIDRISASCAFMGRVDFIRGPLGVGLVSTH